MEFEVKPASVEEPPIVLSNYMESSDHRNCITTNRIHQDQFSANDNKDSPLAKEFKEDKTENNMN
jgi:hypothetical protein